jgi:hypothetical protein
VIREKPRRSRSARNRSASAERDELGKRHQPRVVVFPHAARIGVADPLQARCALADREQLVDLLLVLSQHHRGARMREQTGDLVVERIAVDAE